MPIGDRYISTSPEVLNPGSPRQAVTVEFQSAVHRDHPARLNFDVPKSGKGHWDGQFVRWHGRMSFADVFRDPSW